MPDRTASIGSLETPIGRLWLAGTDAGLLAIARFDTPDALIAELARRRWMAVPDPEPVAEALRALSAYFAGSSRSLTAPLDLRELPPFDAAAYRAATMIPFGETASYGEVAAIAGSPRAARAVGAAMARCQLFPVVPCHRVIHADGSIRGWGRDLWVKRWMLDHERPPLSPRLPSVGGHAG